MSPHAPRAVLRLLPDEPLARLAAGGSEPAFDVLYTRHAAGLTASCRRILRNDEDARDALQNTMLKAWAALERRGDAPLRLWLHRIAHNESVSLLRRRRPSAELPQSAAAITDVHAVAADRAELAATLDDIGELTGRQREALLMRTLGDASYDDIAATLCTSPAAARQSVTSARRALRRRRLAGVLPIPAWVMELSSLASSGTSALSGQVAGRAAATLGAAVATVGVVHAPATVHHPAAPARAAAQTRAAPRPAATAVTVPAAATSVPAAPVTTAPRTASSRKARGVTPLVRRPSHTSVSDDDAALRDGDDESQPLGGAPDLADTRLPARRAPAQPDAGGDAPGLSGDAGWRGPGGDASPDAGGSSPMPAQAPASGAPPSEPQTGATQAPPAP
jgi:RNA polymerase sigma factor (sigma-70 family)